jgi:hypothetical protein
LLVSAAAALLTLGLAGCSSDPAGSTDSATAPAATSQAASPAGSGSAQLCGDVDAAQASLQALTGTDILNEGTSALKENFADFEASVQTLLDSARSDFASESDAVKAAVDSLKTAIGELSASPSVADAAAVVAALKPVQESVTTLLTAVKDAC